MENSSQFSTQELQQKALEHVNYLRSTFNSNEDLVENLHTLFVSYAAECGAQDEVVSSYLALRHFLKQTEAMFNPKNENHG